MTTRKAILRTLFLYLTWAAVTSNQAFGGPARPGVITVAQSDGSTIRIKVQGDEFHNLVTTVEGYTLTPDADGDWAFARLDTDGRLVSTGVKAKPMSNLSTAERETIGKSLRKGIHPDRQTDLQKRLSRERTYPLITRNASDLVPPLIGGTSWKPEGQKKVLVILAEYSDTPFRKGDNAAFNELLNSRNFTVGGATGSVWQYYHDNSNGLFDPEFTVVGPYTLSKKRAWYKERPEEMVAEAATLANKDVDFSQFAENGVAHDIFVYYSGGAESSGDAEGIWPHRSILRGLSLDGVKIPGYACSSELEPSQYGNNVMAAIGSFCHEFGHVIGLPDLYDTAKGNATNCDLPGCFSLMAYGSYNNRSRTPPALSILERWMLGWSEPEALESTGEYSLAPVTDGKGYLVKTEATGDYFLLECRGVGKTDWDKKEHLDNYGQGSDWGLLVYHVRNEGAFWTGNTVNATAGNEHYRFIYSNPDAENGYPPHFLPTHCFFPGGRNVTSIYSDVKSGFTTANGKSALVEIPSIRLNDAQGHVKLSVIGRDGNISDIKAKAYQHDILLSWKDDHSSSWAVEWKEEESEAIAGEVKGLASSEAHIPLLKDNQEYTVTISGDRNSSTSITLKTEKAESGFPRIRTSNSTYNGKTLLMLVDCGEIGNIIWTIDGAKTSGFQNISKGERCVKAVLQRKDGRKEYFVRFINVKE